MNNAKVTSGEMRAGPVPYQGSDETKVRQIERMFDSIASSYDALNHLFSIGIDRRWRRIAIGMVAVPHPRRVLDIATGTGDLLVEIDRQLRPEEITGVDLSEGMLRIAKEKSAASRVQAKTTFTQCDTADLPLEDDSFELVTAAFGVRNFEDPLRCLTEMHRVLSPAGRCMILEFSRPRGLVVGRWFGWYFGKVVPAIGRLVSKNADAYRYLPRSVAVFPEGDEFLQIMRAAGFSEVSARRLSLGLCTIYLGSK